LLRLVSIVAAGPLLLSACGGAAVAASPGSTDTAVVSAVPSPTTSAPAGPSSTPAATASASAPSPAPTGAFHLVKSCTGYICTVTASNYAAIPIGSTISYSGSSNDALTAQIKAVGGTATGTCSIATLPGKCSFATGTGSLAKFHEDLVVTQDSSGLWIWDGPLAG
jgi:hypothetical protein